MVFKRCKKESFSIIGKEGSTHDGSDFVQKLWAEANGYFHEIAHLVKYNSDGAPEVWGAMTDFSRAFMPWENNFSEGLYLAGAEVGNDVQPPQGWTKWTIPAFSYVYGKADVPDAFMRGLAFLADEGLTLCGAVQEYYCAGENGQMYLFYPVSRD